MLTETIPVRAIPAETMGEPIPAGTISGVPADDLATWVAPGGTAQRHARAHERSWIWRFARWQALPLLGAAVAVGTALSATGAAGFPVDDGWIHQDFARTLATTGHFAFQPGGGAAGATSPLWVLLLTPPYLLAHGHPPIWVVVGWAALLGGLALAGLGLLAGQAAATIARRHGTTDRAARIAAGLAGLAVVAQWPLVWAAVSGMETDLFAFLALLLIVAASRRAHPLWLGLLAGAAIAARPEGALVAALVAAGAAWAAVQPGWPHPRARMRTTGHGTGLAVSRPGAWPSRLGAWAWRWGPPYAAGTLVLVIPYVALNLVASGHPLPSTFYAKRVGMGGLDGSLARVASFATQMASVLLALNPALLAVAALAAAYWIHRLIHGRRGGLGAHQRSRGLSPARRGAGRPYRVSWRVGVDAADAGFPLVALLWLWPLALAAALATAMPGAWQYGRYLMPALPPLAALLAASLAPLAMEARPRVLPLVGLVVGVAAAVSVVGARQISASDVRSIDNYHVAAALWLRAHAAPGAVIATHDIGAIGYFSGHPVIDFAGLADPELIPILENQPAIEAYLRRHHAAYVVMGPNWFPPPNLLVRDLAGRDVYGACGLGECFVVYRTGW